jgi:hypothetical protein
VTTGMQYPLVRSPSSETQYHMNPPSNAPHRDPEHSRMQYVAPSARDVAHTPSQVSGVHASPWAAPHRPARQ